MQSLTLLLVAEPNGNGTLSALLTDGFAAIGPLGALEALAWLARSVPDAVVVDGQLAPLSARELCSILRQRPTMANTLLVVVSDDPGEFLAGDRSIDVVCTTADANDLSDRLKQRLPRRACLGFGRSGPYYGARLIVEFDRFYVAVDGVMIRMTKRELQMLEYLIANRNSVVTRGEILRDVWRGQNDGHSRTIDSHVRRLRQKLKGVREMIETVPGLGYRFREGVDEPPSANATSDQSVT